MSVVHFPRLQWVCTQPTPYNDFLFRSLAVDPAIDLTVHFIETMLPSHPWKSQMARGFKSRTYKRILGLDWHLLRLAVLDKQSFFIIGGWHEPTVISLINLLIMTHYPFAIWTDTPNLTQKRNPLKALLRDIWLQRIFTHARYVMGTGVPALTALGKMNCDKNKLVNFPYYIDLNFFKPITKPTGKKNDGQLIFLSSGRLLNSDKGYDLAIRALAIVKERKIIDNFLYRIAGAGPDEQAIKSLAEQTGILENLELIGWLEPDMLPDFYRSGDIFLHPARFDPYGNSILEAMACGLPIIGSDKTGAVSDRIEHMRNGLVHNSDDIEDFVEKVIYLITHREKLNVIGKEARATAELWPVSIATKTIKSIMSGISQEILSI
jgi:glycosyltransferase involved in cell wall biosynthesis